MNSSLPLAGILAIVFLGIAGPAAALAFVAAVAVFKVIEHLDTKKITRRNAEIREAMRGAYNEHFETLRAGRDA